MKKFLSGAAFCFDMKKIMLSLLMFFGMGLVSAQGFAPERDAMLWTSYVALVVLLVGLVFVVYSIKKLKYGWRDVWRSVWISFLIALVISLVVSGVLSSFAQYSTKGIRVDCANPPCPIGMGVSSSDSFMMFFVIALPVLFFVSLVMYHIVVLIRNRRN